MRTGWLAFTDAYFYVFNNNVTMKLSVIISMVFILFLLKLSLCYLLSQFRDAFI